MEFRKNNCIIIIETANAVDNKQLNIFIMERKNYPEKNLLLLEEYGALQGQSEEEKMRYILEHGGCTFEEFREEVLKKIKEYYNQSNA